MFRVRTKQSRETYQWTENIVCLSTYRLRKLNADYKEMAMFSLDDVTASCWTQFSLVEVDVIGLECLMEKILLELLIFLSVRYDSRFSSQRPPNYLSGRS